MASIFTFESEVARITSPWDLQSSLSLTDEVATYRGEGTSIGKLCHEPQEGSIEYKLHLLLRSRPMLVSVTHLPHVEQGPHSQLNINTDATSAVPPASNPLLTQARQHRLEQLTTQLLWRLQQSSSNHASSPGNIILPALPEVGSILNSKPQIGRLINGLEDSQGALYEIGVADDGTLVGLTEDEMFESLTNLRAMAACLGCEVDIIREVVVGTAEWYVSDPEADNNSQLVRGPLIVAEASVKPVLLNVRQASNTEKVSQIAAVLPLSSVDHISRLTQPEKQPVNEQLRVSLTGATFSGKSSLLGTLTTSALDNARGKSRLFLLKHRHEIDSGQTSSISQELIGYCTGQTDSNVRVINYATDNVTSWGDIHTAADGGRLVLLSDSAGHLRYRRTAVRSLVGWAPHWTLLCISADSLEADSLSGNSNKANPQGVLDMSEAYLDLCIRLDLPLVVVLTKLDCCSKTALRSTLGRLLTILKQHNRRPCIVPLPSTPRVVEEEKQDVEISALHEVRKLLGAPDFDAKCTIPIVMTSAVQGNGISLLHALLSQLPLRRPSDAVTANNTIQPSLIFQVEETYTRSPANEFTVVAGHMQKGTVSIGDRLYIGPLSMESFDDSEDSDFPQRRKHMPPGRTLPAIVASRHIPPKQDMEQEWQLVTVSSIRNLRAPVTMLYEDQAGTIGFMLCKAAQHPGATSIVPRPQSIFTKGMVLVSQPCHAISTITARFQRDDLGVLAVGSQVVIYVHSVRSTARILSAKVPGSAPASPLLEGQNILFEDVDDNLPSVGSQAPIIISRNDGGDHPLLPRQRIAGEITHEYLLVTLRIEGSRQYVEAGSKILVMPGGAPTSSPAAVGGEKPSSGALDIFGFVGSVVEVA